MENIITRALETVGYAEVEKAVRHEILSIKTERREYAESLPKIGTFEWACELRTGADYWYTSEVEAQRFERTLDGDSAETVRTLVRAMVWADMMSLLYGARYGVRLADGDVLVAERVQDGAEYVAVFGRDLHLDYVDGYKLMEWDTQVAERGAALAKEYTRRMYKYLAEDGADD